MKRKEVCEKAGLTPKALRLYEEKGLIQPQVDASGHNKSREYSQEDLRRLKTIAMLRRALFTIAEIKEMLDKPGAIQEIYPQYLEWLRQQKEQLEQLFEVSSAVDITTVRSAQELTEKIKFAAAHMPLPASDIHFNFKKLDELEDQRRVPTPDEMLNAALPSKEHRQAYVALSRDKLDNALLRNDLLNDTKDMPWVEDGPVRNEREYRTKGQRALRWLLVLAAVISGCVAYAYYWVRGPVKWIMLGVFVVTLAARIVLQIQDQRKKREQWLGSIGWENPKAKRAVKPKKLALIVMACVLVLALVVGGFTALAWYLIPTEPLGGPSTEGIDLKEFWDGMELERFSGIVPNVYPGAYDLKEPDAITSGPDKIYFIWRDMLYSINADYTDLTRLDRASGHDGALSVVQEPQERACDLIYYDRFIYYCEDYSLMRHETGAKIKPKSVYSWEQAPGGIGLSEDGEIICYVRENGGKWTEEARIQVD